MYAEEEAKLTENRYALQSVFEMAFTENINTEQ